MIDGGEFLLETMHRRDYPNHPLWKHAAAVVLFVKARRENQYIVAEYIFNSLVFFWFVFPKCFLQCDKLNLWNLCLYQYCWDLNILFFSSTKWVGCNISGFSR